MYCPVQETLSSNELKGSLLSFWSMCMWEGDRSQLPLSTQSPTAGSDQTQRGVTVAPDFPKHLGQGTEEQVGPLCPFVRPNPQIPRYPQRPLQTDSSVCVFQLGRLVRGGSYAIPSILAPPPWLPHAQGTKFAKTKMSRTFGNRTTGEAKLHAKQ